MRCPDCNKFVPYNSDEEPETDQLEVSDEGQVTGSVRIVNSCEECGTELKEANIDIDHTLGLDESGKDGHGSQSTFEEGQTIEAHTGEGHELSFEAAGEGRDSYNTGRGRRAPTMYGFEIEFKVTCSCQKAAGSTIDDIVVATGTLRGAEQASFMDDLV